MTAGRVVPRGVTMNLQFIGAAGTVTGSKTLVTANGRQLLVDCGLFQGCKNLCLLNWEAFPFDPKQLEAAALTHAHLDHSGALPLRLRIEHSLKWPAGVPRSGQIVETEPCAIQ